MDRMELNLTDRVAMALGAYTDYGEFLQGGTARLRREADAALAALGLDDLDAAVERGASALALHVGYNPNHIAPENWAPIKADYEQRARIVLEAALTATKGPHDGD